MESSRPSTPTPERDQILAVGKRCSHSQCMLVDFLPFNCQHCRKSFCQEHFKVEAHQCPQYDESKHNRVAPNCESLYICQLVHPTNGYVTQVLCAILQWPLNLDRIRISEWRNIFRGSAWQRLERQLQRLCLPAQEATVRRYCTPPSSVMYVCASHLS